MNQPPCATPVREGEVLAGKYRVERVLGEGGMGVVVAATHIQLDQRLALKFVRPDAVESRETIERFTREARAACKLRSEHVARVLDVGTLDNGAPFMVMEYLDGRDLAGEVDQRGPLPFPEAAEFVLQACEAIAEAHAIGIIHRDLKPQNLFLTRRVDGRPLVKVLDFGISKFNGAQSGDNMSLTKTHAVMGSPNYMSPEQLRSARSVDQRTDIWALGVILYELLTGRVPFVATSVTELCAMVLQDTPRPIRQQRPDVPDGLTDVVARCLEKDPQNRFQSIASLAHALEPFALSTNPGAAQRILAVARESSARGLGAPAHASGPPPPLASSQRVAMAGPPGKTSVSWAETEVHKPTKSALLPLVILTALGTTFLLVAAFVVVRVVIPRHRAAAHAATSTVASVVPAQADPATTHAATPPPPPPAVASSVAAATTAPNAASAPERPAGATPGTRPSRPSGPHPAAPTGGKKNPDQDTPDERN